MRVRHMRPEDEEGKEGSYVITLMWGTKREAYQEAYLEEGSWREWWHRKGKLVVDGGRYA